MTNLTIVKQHGQLMVESRQVAEMVGKEHKNLLRDIQGYTEILGQLNFELTEFFIESTYLSEQKKVLPCFLITKKGCDMVANKMTGEKGVLFTATYINKFHDMEKQITGQQIPESKVTELEIKNKNADARLKNANIRQANFLLENSKKYSHLLCKEAMSLLAVNAFEMIAGKNTLPRPKVADIKYYTATEIGKLANVSANKVGKVANANELKTEQYGITVLDKSRSSSKQMPVFRYNEAGKDKILELLGKVTA